MDFDELAMKIEYAIKHHDYQLTALTAYHLRVLLALHECGEAMWEDVASKEKEYNTVIKWAYKHHVTPLSVAEQIIQDRIERNYPEFH